MFVNSVIMSAGLPYDFRITHNSITKAEQNWI